MTYGDFTRQVYIGLEATEGTRSAKMRNVRTSGEPQHTLHNGTIIPDENTGTRMTDNGNVRGPAWSEFRVSAYLYYDQLVTWLVGAIGPDTAAVASGETTVFDHTVKGGVNSPKPMSIEWNNGLYWSQILGARINTLDVMVYGNELAKIDASFIGRASTALGSPPTPIADTPAAYNHPIDIPQQSVTLGGSAYAYLISMKYGIRNNLNPLWVINTTTAMARQRIGKFQVELDGVADYPDYATSIYKKFRDGTAITDLVVTLQDTTNIGVAPSHPKIEITVPKPVLLDTAEGSEQGVVTQLIKGRAKYDTTSACGIKFVVTNENNQAYYEG